MDPKNISLISIAPFGTWQYSGEAVMSINSTQYTTNNNKKVGIQYWAIDRYNPTATPAYSYFQDAQGALDQVPPGIENYVSDHYILVVVTQGIFVTQVPQGALYTFLVKIGAGPLLEMLEQVNTYYACGFTGKIAYTLITVPGTPDFGLEFGLIPQSVYTSSGPDNYQYGATTYPGASLIAQLVPTTFDGKTLYSPVLTTNQSV